MYPLPVDPQKKHEHLQLWGRDPPKRKYPFRISHTRNTPMREKDLIRDPWIFLFLERGKVYTKQPARKEQYRINRHVKPGFYRGAAAFFKF